MEKNPVVVGGMHRSGTSLAASMLAANGIDMGREMLAADAANPRGYFEDLEFLGINQKLLYAATPHRALGHRDWGWTIPEGLNRRRLGPLRDTACRAIKRRREASGRWGWKDPRTTLLLDFWHELLIEAGLDPVYLLLYRFPWEVADSMQRLGFDLFLRRPEYAYPIWMFYNRHLLEFFTRHRDRCLLAAANAAWAEPARFGALLSERFGVELTVPLEQIQSPELWRARPGPDPIARLAAAASPEAVDLLRELDRHAGLSSTGMWETPTAPALTAGEGEAIELSVVIPCYNDGDLLLDAIASVERCAPPRSELIVVDDGSTAARTLQVLESLRSLGYRVLHQSNRGAAAARNLGIGSAGGEFVLVLDADDRLLSGFPAKALGILRSKADLGVVFGDAVEFGLRRGRARLPEPNAAALQSGDWVPSCLVFRRSLWAECGGYSSGLRSGESWDLLLAARERGWHLHRMGEPAFERRVRPDSLSMECADAETARRRAALVLERHAG